MTNLKSTLSIYNFSSLPLFLSHCFKTEKQKTPSLTVKDWADQIGFDSPDVLVSILKGKSPVKMKLADLLRQGLNLDASEFNYLKALILNSYFKSEEEKAAFEVLLSQYRPQSSLATVIRVDDGSVFSSWLDSAIVEMTKLQDFRLSEDQIEKRLRKKVSKEVLNERIQKLKEVGLLEETGDGNLKAIQAAISTTTDYPIASVQKYYTEVSQLAAEASVLPTGEREFQCFSMAMNSKELLLVKTMLRDVRARLENSAGSSPDSQQVYQINLQCFPVTHGESENAIVQDR